MQDSKLSLADLLTTLISFQKGEFRLFFWKISISSITLLSINAYQRFYWIISSWPVRQFLLVEAHATRLHSYSVSSTENSDDVELDLEQM